MWLLVVLTLVAFADGLRRMGAAWSDRIWIETWRTFAYVVFAGLFAILAWRPRQSPGIWELVFAHKTAVVLYGLPLGDVPEAHVAIAVDAVLVLLIAVGWWLTRGWESWRRLKVQQVRSVLLPMSQCSRLSANRKLIERGSRIIQG
jgi:hypothetical protein